ncbi:MAG: class I SAM-dependent methyltransferase [Planctomycetes bacterium]|nr:class I SAM-dependent methyltransferase [Planctomycetota bacterium]
MLRKIFRPIMAWVRSLLSRPDERGNLTSDLFRLKIRERVRQLITKNRALLLDIGCGEGLLYEKIATSKRELCMFGIDADHESLHIAKSRFHQKSTNNRSFLQAIAQKLPFRDSSFDFVVCINTFYNFSRKEDVLLALNEMARVCKRNGFIIFDVRNKLNPLVYLGFKWVWVYDTHVTLRAYSLKELTTALVSRGMVVKEIVPIGFPLTLFAPIILVKIGFSHCMKREEVESID